MRYSIWLKLFPNISASICNILALEEFNDYVLQEYFKFQFRSEFKLGTLFSGYLVLIFIFVLKFLAKYDKTYCN